MLKTLVKNLLKWIKMIFKVPLFPDLLKLYFKLRKKSELLKFYANLQKYWSCIENRTTSLNIIIKELVHLIGSSHLFIWWVSRISRTFTHTQASAFIWFSSYRQLSSTNLDKVGRKMVFHWENKKNKTRYKISIDCSIATF